jgi:uncharacterized membrane protein YfhO
MKRNKTEKKHNKQTAIKQEPLVKKQITKDIKAVQFKFMNVWFLLSVIIVIGIIAFNKYLTGDFLFFFKDIGSDSINQNYPALVHKAAIIKNEYFSKWSFFRGSGDKYVVGFPIDPYGLYRQIEQYISVGGSGVDYFVNGRFLRIFIYQIILGGLIAFFYFRTISVKKSSSVIGALLLSFSGFMVVGSSWGFSSHIFKAVFFLFSFEQLYIKKRWYFFPFAVIYLSGSPFALFIYSVFLFTYSVFRYFSDNFDVGLFLKLTGKMIMLGLAGLFMNLVNIVPSFLKMYFSPRVSGNASYTNLLSSRQDIVENTNITATTILRFFSSDILGNGSKFQGWQNYFEAPLFYIGLLTLLIFPQIFIYLDKRKKIVFGSFLGFWALTLIFPYLRHAMLAFTGDYFRYGFDFFIPFTLLFFAVYALNELDKTFKLNYKLLGGTLVVLLVALFFPYKSLPITAIDNDLRMIIVLILFLYSGLLVLMSKPKYKQYAQIGLILLVIVELSYFSYKSYAGRVPVTKEEFAENAGGYKDGTIKAVNYIKSIDKTLFYRTEKDYQSGNAIHGSLNDAMAQGYYGTTSYSSFNQLNYVRFLEETGLIQKGDETATRWITGFRGNPLLQTFGNVKYHLSKSENPDMIRFGFDSINRIDGVTILKNRFFLPFGYTYDKYIRLDDYKKLTYYQITQQSLNNIFTETERARGEQVAKNLIDRLNPILGKTYASDIEIDTDLTQILGKEENNKIKLLVRKYSVNNFENQIALLNAFVYEGSESSDIKIKEFKQVKLSDTSVFIPPTKFNFKIYGKLVDELKADTFQITRFSQADIKGKIELSKTKMLFFTIPFDKGWKIKINGKDKMFSRVNIGFTGIVLPKGNYEIELYYVPQYSQISFAISIISIILFWLFLGYDVYRKRKLKYSQ